MYHIAFAQQSNRASWVFTGLVTDLDNNPIDLTGCSLEFVARIKRRGGYYGSGFYGDYDGGGCLAASTDIGNLTIIGLGMFQWFFTSDQMRSLCPGTYDTGLTLTSSDGTETVQLAIGPLAIVDGVVS
jgi:hypothetical protein